MPRRSTDVFITSLDPAAYAAAPAPSRADLRAARERACADLRRAARAPRRPSKRAVGGVLEQLDADAELAELAQRVAQLARDACLRDTLLSALLDALEHAAQDAAQDAALATWAQDAQVAAQDAYEAAVRPEAREAARIAYLDSLTVTRRSAGVHTGRLVGPHTTRGASGLGTRGGARREACARAGSDAGATGEARADR